MDEVIISSTVPRVVFNLRVLADRYFGCRPLVVGKPECRLPQPPRVDAGTQVGPDRLVNAAHHLTLTAKSYRPRLRPDRPPPTAAAAGNVRNDVLEKEERVD